MRIAICDDEINEANNIRFALMDAESRLEIDIFESGYAFLDSIKGGSQYDLVFMEIFLGNENGMDIVRAMQAISPDTQVIFSTISADHAVEAFEVNAIGYLVKPFNEADIVKAFAPYYTTTLLANSVTPSAVTLIFTVQALISSDSSSLDSLPLAFRYFTAMVARSMRHTGLVRPSSFRTAR